MQKLMKITSALTVLVATGIVTEAAQFQTTQEWSFSSLTLNGASVNADAGYANEFGVPTATIDRGTGSGWKNTITTAGYGTQQGTWDIAGAGKISLNIPSSANDYTDITLQIVQFVGAGGLYSGNLSFSLANVNIGSATTVETADNGTWYKNTYSWHLTPGNQPLTLDISGLAGAAFKVDDLKMVVDGSLTAVPEPIVTQSVAAAGLLAFGFMWRRRKN